jgi:hypothetical protein
MAGTEIVHAALRARPEMVVELLRRLAPEQEIPQFSLVEGPPPLLPHAPAPLLLVAPGSWVLVQVLSSFEPALPPALGAALARIERERGPGDVVLIVARTSVARRARSARGWSGPLGTRIRVTPRVLRLGLRAAEELAGGDASLGLVAAWAAQHRQGPRSREVAAQAVAQAAQVDPGWLRATLQLLSGPQLAHIAAMSIDETPESAAFRSFRGAIEAEAEARGAGQALLRFLELRGMPLSDEQRAHIAGCRDPLLVRRWVEQVFSAATTGAMLEALFASVTAPEALNRDGQAGCPPDRMCRRENRRGPGKEIRRSPCRLAHCT